MFTVTYKDTAVGVLRPLPEKLNTNRLLRLIGNTLVGDYGRNMRNGVDANGKKLAPVQKWTRLANRAASAKTSGMIPLRNTGDMANNMKIIQQTPVKVEVGFTGAERVKALRQQKGIAGMMQVREKGRKGWYSGIRTGKTTGEKYIRFKTNDGNWFTKRVNGDKVAIRPRKRPFLWLADSQIAKIQGQVDGAVKRALERVK